MSVPIVVRGGILATNGVELPVDPFGRVRVSDSSTMFQATSVNLVPTVRPLQLESQVSFVAGGAVIAQNEDASVVSMSVGGSDPCVAVRQSRRYVSYQPGKGRLIFISAMLAGSEAGHPAGITSRIGVFDDRNVGEARFGDGFFFQVAGADLSVVERASVTGSQVDTVVPRASWNGDRLDGSGPSGINLRLDRMHLFWMDMEWLGVGDVRMGVVVDAQLIRCHTFSHVNALTGSYIRTPKLPVRHEIAAVGTTAAGSMKQACATVLSEGGFVPRGLPVALGRDVTGTALAAETVAVAVSLRTDGFAPRATLVPDAVSIVSPDNKSIYWRMLIDYTGAGIGGGSVVWNNVNATNSHARYSVSAGIPIPASAVCIADGLVVARTQHDVTFRDQQGLEGIPYLASTYAGVPDTLYIAVRRLTTDAVYHITVAWNEITV
jgi:hypothetical protein